MTGYRTLAKEFQEEFTEKRSRFIGQVKPVQTEQEAQTFIEKIRKKHWDAKHTVYAYILKDEGITRFSDDGEPQGTAGVPVLAVLQKKGLFDVVAVVTRYFGGILLGSGGLIRAYGHAASIACEGAGVLNMEVCCIGRLICPYPLIKAAQEAIDCYHGIVEETIYEEEVSFRFYVQKEDITPLQEQLTEISCGQLSVELFGEEYRCVSQVEK